MPKLRPFQNWAAALTALMVSAGSFALADTITLKNGDKIEGKVLSETDKEIKIEERISANITDTRTVPKGDVVKIDKVAQDEPAFQALKNLVPGANSLPAANYDQVLRSLNNFVNSYAQSSHVPDVQKQIAAWQEEKKRVDAGEVKLSNRWLSKEEADREKYQISGQLVLNYMQQQQRQGDLTGALNSFDQLEKNFPGSRAYIDAVEAAKAILPAVKASADRTLQTYKVQQADREKGIQLLSETQKAETLAAIKRDEQKAEAAADAASKSGLKWPPLVPNERALTTISSLATEEQRRLAEIPVAKMRQSVQVTEKARAAMAEKKFDDADQGLKQAIELWNTNELAPRLQNELGTLRNATPETASTSTTETSASTPAASTDATASTDSNASSNEGSSENAAADNQTGDEEPPFYKTPFGMVTMLILTIVIVAVFSAFRKISKRAGEVIE